MFHSFNIFSIWGSGRNSEQACIITSELVYFDQKSMFMCDNVNFYGLVYETLIFGSGYFRGGKVWCTFLGRFVYSLLEV